MKMENNMRDVSHVLLIYRKFIPSIYLCGHSQMKMLEAQRLIEYRTREVDHLNRSDLQWADVVLLGRLDSWFELQVVRWLRDMGKYLVYVIDDDLLNTPSALSSTKYYHSQAVQQRILEMMRLSDAILSPSPLILERYAREDQGRIILEEPAVEPVSYVSHTGNRSVKVGFAGSIDRTEDLERLLGEALLRIKNRYGECVQFEFFGAIPSFAEQIGARVWPYCTSYEKYRKQLNAFGWDIGLAPMPDTPFHACKHYIKFIEYAASGCLGIFSDVQPYVRLKDIGVPAVFCGNRPEEWEKALSALIEDEARREKARKTLCKVAQENFDVTQIAKTLYDSQPQVFDFQAPLVDCRKPVGLYRVVGYGDRVVQLVRMHGWGFPAYAVGKMGGILHQTKKK